MPRKLRCAYGDLFLFLYKLFKLYLWAHKAHRRLGIRVKRAALNSFSLSTYVHMSQSVAHSNEILWNT